MSEWKEGAIVRRDERQTKIPDIRKPSGSNKDTKKWCRGRVGRDHKLVCADYNTFKGTTYFKGWKVLVCESCRKQLDYYFPSPFSPTPEPPPSWAKVDEAG